MSVTIFKNNSTAQGLFNVSPGGTIALLRIGDLSLPGLGAYAVRAIITECAIQEAANVNVMYGADGHTYLHVPGDKVGSLTITGLAFSGDCSSGGGEDTLSDHFGYTKDMTGLERVLTWYRKYRVSNPSSTPVEIVLSGQTELKGYLGSLSGRIADVATRLQQFNLSLYLAPEVIGEAGAAA